MRALVVLGICGNPEVKINIRIQSANCAYQCTFDPRKCSSLSKPTMQGNSSQAQPGIILFVSKRHYKFSHEYKKKVLA